MFFVAAESPSKTRDKTSHQPICTNSGKEFPILDSTHKNQTNLQQSHLRSSSQINRNRNLGLIPNCQNQPSWFSSPFWVLNKWWESHLHPTALAPRCRTSPGPPATRAGRTPQGLGHHGQLQGISRGFHQTKMRIERNIGVYFGLLHAKFQFNSWNWEMVPDNCYFSAVFMTCPSFWTCSFDCLDCVGPNVNQPGQCTQGTYRKKIIPSNGICVPIHLAGSR